jgi:hypothetical protein
MAQSDTVGKGRHEMLQAEVDCLLKLGAEVLKAELGNVVTRGEYGTGL